MKPSEQFEFAREVYRYIAANPLVSRGIMNSHFRTTSDDRRNRQLSDALDALLARLYVFKYHDEGTAQVFFWTAEFKDSPYEPDDEPLLDYTPVDVFGPAPVDPEPVAPPPPQPFVAEAPAPSPSEPEPEKPVLNENSPEYKAMLRMHEKLNGNLKQAFSVMMQDPQKIFGKADDCFSFLGNHIDRARFLGRMFGLGAIRRFKDPLDKTVSYYTIFGACPESLVEDTVQLSKAAQRRQKEAQEALQRQQTINSVKQGIEDRKQPHIAQEEPHSEEPDEEEEQVEEDTDEVVEEADQEDAPEIIEPACYLSNTGEIFIRRKDNTSVDLDTEESAAVLELFRMMNPIVLDQLVERVKARKAKASE
jgi:hypothetical protein